MILILVVVFVILLFLNVPIAYCMLLSSLAALVYIGIDPLMIALETSRALPSLMN